MNALAELVRMFVPTLKQRSILTAEQLEHWTEHGYVVLPGLFSSEQLQTIDAEVDHHWAVSRTQRSELVVDLIGSSGARILLHEAPIEARQVPYKLNDLYLVSDRVRQVILAPTLVRVLTELLGGAPLVCNSLNLEFGSQQPCHTDSLYMTPPRDLNLVASWIPLEDCVAEAGPLRFFPGSHKIPPFRFSSGKITAIESEMPRYQQYMQEHVDRLGLKEKRFCASAGDVFLWHSQLYHGGAPIENARRTRRSIVTHYFLAEDMPKSQRVRQVPGGYWLRRSHQPTN